MRRIVLAAVLVAAGAAFGQDRPATAPTRDVDVTYRARAGAGAIEQRSRFAAAAGKVRIDTPSPGVYVILDRGARRMDMVSDGDRGVVELPYDPKGTAGGLPAGGTFVATGRADTVAGVPCREWQTTDNAGHPVVACFSDDGVMLRARSGDAVLVEAVRVAYGPIAPSVFDIPAGYARAMREKAP